MTARGEEEESDAEISLARTDCTHFHLSPPSPNLFPSGFLPRADKWKQRRGREVTAARRGAGYETMPCLYGDLSLACHTVKSLPFCFVLFSF